MQRKEKEKRSGGISFKKIFRSITSKPNNNGNGNGNSDHRAYSPRALLPSSDNQFALAHGEANANASMKSAYWGNNNNNGTAPMMQRSPPKSSYTSGASYVDDNGAASFATPPKPQSTDANVLRWGLVLSRIPKLVAESTSISAGATSPGGSASSSPTAGMGSTDSGGSLAGAGSPSSDLLTLLESLQQMAAKECQAQILQYYTGNSNGMGAATTVGMANINILSNWEQRKVFKQCRRSLLLCWKFIIAQLNDERVNKSLSKDSRDTYYQLLGLIAERVEFNLMPDPKDPSTGGTLNANGRPPHHHQKQRSSSHSGAHSPSASSSTESNENHNSSNGHNHHVSEESGNEGERDIYLYRCLLVATFKHVIENIDAANLKKRAFISYVESQFFAKILAVCFYRIPVVQRMILDGLYEAYRNKKWTKTTAGTTTNTSTTSSAPPTPAQLLQSRLNRRRSSSKPWNGMTFIGTLARWSEFEGQVLCEYADGNDLEGKAADSTGKLSESSATLESSGDNNSNSNTNNGNGAGNPFAPPSRAVVDKFKRQNPTLFRWTRYSPYLGPYADSDVFRTHESSHAAWMLKLTQDGEFFASFMTSYMEHADFVSIGGDPLWACLPGHTLLIRLSMLLVKEALWQKWLLVKDTTDNVINYNMTVNNNAQDGERIAFEIKNMRGIRNILDGVVHLLKNRDVLESCVLAAFECTNVLNGKSVGICLTRLEEWFGAAAIPMGETNGGEILYRVPANFYGHALGTAVRIMLCSESFQILNRTLLFLYNRMDYFDGDLRQNVLKAIVQRHMFLFLHWNADVRSSYHHLLVYKIVRTNRYLLDSPIDQLLVGRFAMFTPDGGSGSGGGLHGRDDHTSAIGFDDTDGPYDEADSRPVLSAAEFNVLRLEQALWRAFDACLAAICVQERRHARSANRKYQVEIQAAHSRAVAFQHLSLKTVGGDDTNSNQVNEGLPGGKASHELDLLNDELNREPPYYLRYLPAEEVSSLDELRRLAQSVKYPAELQVYAAISLRGYSDLLKQYFYDLRDRGFAEPPPLGFV